MGVPSRLSRCLFSSYGDGSTATSYAGPSPAIAESGAEGHPSWFETKKLLLREKKGGKKVIYLGTSPRCHMYPSKRQRSRQVTPDMSETWTGRGEEVRLLFQLKTEAIRLQHKKPKWIFEVFFNFFKKGKGYLKAVPECRSVDERSVPFGKAPFVKIFDRAFIKTPLVNNRSCQYSLFFFLCGCIKMVTTFPPLSLP